jgi:hypothetical protein
MVTPVHTAGRFGGQAEHLIAARTVTRADVAPGHCENLPVAETVPERALTDALSGLTAFVLVLTMLGRTTNDNAGPWKGDDVSPERPVSDMLTVMERTRPAADSSMAVMIARGAET